MIKFYYHPSPNPAKVALFLEESGLEYETVPVDTRKGEQHSPSFRAINPNAKDARRSWTAKRPSSNSSAILLYLAEKTGRFLPENTPKARGELFSWLFFVASGVGPYSGQAFHFNAAAPEKIEYAINRYNFETHRHWKILDDRLAGRKYVLGDTYTIVDMSVWGWSSAAPYLLGAETWSKMANVKRLVDEINAAPGRRSRQQIEGKACLQARVRRRGQAASVSASDAKGRLTSRSRRQAKRPCRSARRSPPSPPWPARPRSRPSAPASRSARRPPRRRARRARPEKPTRRQGRLSRWRLAARETPPASAARRRARRRQRMRRRPGSAWAAAPSLKPSRRARGRRARPWP